jgi:hypothetical protein
MKGIVILVAIAAICIALLLLLWPADNGSQVQREVELLRARGEATRVALDNRRVALDNQREAADVQVAQDTAPIRAASINSLMVALTSIALISTYGIPCIVAAAVLVYLISRFAPSRHLLPSERRHPETRRLRR